MPAFGTQNIPVRTSVPIEINAPENFLLAETFGDEWWLGLHSWWDQMVPSSVTKAESVLINPLVRMPWTIIDPDGNETRPDDPGYPAWLTDPMLLNGSSGGSNTGAFDHLDRIDRFDFWGRWVRDAMRYGFGVVRYGTRSDRREPLAGTLKALPPICLYRGEDGWAIETDGRIQAIDFDGFIEGTSQRILLLRHSLPGGVFGRHRQELQLAQRARMYSAEALDSNTPSGVLTTDQPINQKQADGARTEWETRLKRRTIAVLGNGSKYQQVVMSPVDAEIVSLLQASDRQVAHMYELSAWELDAPSGDSMTYSNLGEKRQDRVDGPLASWSARIEETLGALLPWGWRIAIDFSEYTKQTGGGGTGGGAMDPPGGVPGPPGGGGQDPDLAAGDLR